MSKKLVLILVVISMVSMMFSIAAAPVPGKAVRLVNSVIIADQFQLSYDVFGFGKHMTFNASYTVDGATMPMSCGYDGYRHVFCKAAGARSFKGKPVIFRLAGYSFYATFPGK